MVTGSDGLDEVSLSGPTRALVVSDGLVEEHQWTPADFGFDPIEVADLRVSGPSDSAARITHFLAGEPGPVRDIILANAAAALWVTGPRDLLSCVSRASEAVDSGRALRLLERWREVSRELS